MIHRGEIYYADLSPVVGSEQGGYRPVVVLQNNKGNRYSTTIIVAPISSKLTKNPLPTHVMVENNCLEKKSVILLEQIRTIDKQRIREKVGFIDNKVMQQINCLNLLNPVRPTFSISISSPRSFTTIKDATILPCENGNMITDIINDAKGIIAALNDAPA